MSNCKQKFLGLDSIDVLMKYINNKIAENGGDARVCTLQVYKYFKNSDALTYPSKNIHYNFDENRIEFPADNDGWGTLKTVIDELENTEGDDAFSYGAIYMSSRVQLGSKESVDTWTEWSKPVKISGENGKSGTDFRFSYDEICPNELREMYPLVPSAENPTVYFWVKPDGSEWPDDNEPGKVWTVYTKDGNSGVQVLYRYKVTSVDDIDSDGKLIPPPAPTSGNDPDWLNTIPNINLSKERPYLWLSTAMVLAGSTLAESEEKGIYTGWSDPILFSTVGKDGDVPNYSITLYRVGRDSDVPNTTPGIFAPDGPYIDPDDTDFDKFLVDNPEWKLVPDESNVIWWQCAIKINGQLGRVMNGTVEEPFIVTRYNVLTQEATPGQFTQLLYAWSSSQAMPNFNPDSLEDNWRPSGWFESPELSIDESPENSLWMTTALASGYNDDGTPNIYGEWSEPVKLTGSRGPLSYDYRIEKRYQIGDKDNPINDPENVEWKQLEGSLRPTSENPYIWTADYLVRYNMKYSTDADGNYIIDDKTGEFATEPIKDAKGNDIYKLIKSYGYYRASGINGIDGEDGNRKNGLVYTKNSETKLVNSFSQENLYIANSTGNVTYNLEFDVLSFVNGYTGKFANIGSGNVTINAGSSFKFVSGETSTSYITLSPQETVELVCCNDGTNKIFLVIGKAL